MAYIVTDAVSTELPRRQLRYMREDRLDVTVMPNPEGSSRGVELARFAPTPERAEAAHSLRQKLGLGPEARVAGFVGRLTKDEGIDDLFKAFLMIEADHSNLHLLLLVCCLEAEDRPPNELLERMEAPP